MPSHHQSVRRIMRDILSNKDVKLHLGERVCEVVKLINKGLTIKCEPGLMVTCEQVFWVTQTSAGSWLKAAGIGIDNQGFILVNDNLQSVTHPHIFAAVDIAKMINYQLPKAGVFAVRQGNPLYEDLRSMILGESLKPYKPQTAYFSLIVTGDGRALANRGILPLPSHQ